jgi:hypothetical protein
LEIDELLVKIAGGFEEVIHANEVSLHDRRFKMNEYIIRTIKNILLLLLCVVSFILIVYAVVTRK